MKRILAVLAVLAALAVSGSAFAQAKTPQFGGCIVGGTLTQVDGKSGIVVAIPGECKLQAGPSVAVIVGKYESGRFSAGLIPGLGYGVVLFPERWYSLGFGGYGQLVVGGNQNEFALSGLLSFANYIRFGAGKTWMQQASGPATGPYALFFGLGAEFGGTPAYLKAAK